MRSSTSATCSTMLSPSSAPCVDAEGEGHYQIASHTACSSASKSCATGCSPSIQLEGRLRTFKEGSAKEEYSHEGLVSHRSAVRSRDLRNDPDLSASNAAWCRTERRWGEGLHLRARPSSSTAGGETRVPSRAPCCPSRLLLILVRTPTPLQRNRRAFGL